MYVFFFLIPLLFFFLSLLLPLFSIHSFHIIILSFLASLLRLYIHSLELPTFHFPSFIQLFFFQFFINISHFFASLSHSRTILQLFLYLTPLPFLPPVFHRLSHLLLSLVTLCITCVCTTKHHNMITYKIPVTSPHNKQTHSGS